MNECVTYPNGWTFIPHALGRMDEMGLMAEEVNAALADPSLTYPGHPGRGGQRRQVRVRHRLAVVVAPDDRSVITVLWHQAEDRSPCRTPLLPDRTQ